MALHQFSAFRSGFLGRLGHLIIVQIIFVCLALLIVIFDPSSHAVESRLAETIDVQEQLSIDVASLLQADPQLKATSSLSSETNSEIIQRLRSDSSVCAAGIFATAAAPSSSDSRIVLLKYTLPEADVELHRPRSSTEPGNEHRRATNLHPNYEYSINADYLNTRHSFPLENGLTVEVVLTRAHGLLISNRDNLQYALLLIVLSSVLIGLLTVYLISERFRRPLAELVEGFKRTASGEVFLMVEPGGDKELFELSSTFNAMSRSLQASHNRLSASNRRLELSNKRLHESRNFLETIIEHVPSGVISTDVEGRIALFNNKAEEYFGYIQSEIRDHRIDEIFTRPVETLESVADKASGVLRGELLAKNKSGSLLPVLVIQSALTDDHGTIIGWVYMIRDISESKSFQEMILRVDRSYVRGQMAADIAHEINNYLAVMSGNLELIPLLLRSGETDKVENSTAIMRESLAKIMKFSEGLIDPHQGETVIALGDINQMVENVLAFLRPQNKFDGIDFRVDLSTDIPLVEFDAAQLQQVMVNLLYNAAEALNETADGTWIEIKTSRESMSETPMVRVEVLDSGAGISHDHHSKLFSSRFTTKPRRNGLGLMLTRKIIESHSGKIYYVSRPVSKFWFDLPARQPVSGLQVEDEKMSSSVAFALE